MHALRQTALGRTTVWAVVILGVFVAGASGCWKSSANSAKSKLEKLKEKKPERPFEAMRVFTEPNERSSFDEKAKETNRIVLATKPGHWTGVLVQGRANLSDFDGLLETTPQDSQQRPIDLERSPFWITTTRGITLPKGQRKIVETLFFAPRPDPNAPVKGSTWIANKLGSRSGGQELDRVPEMVEHMPSFQYFLVVLARQGARYAYLNDLGSVRPPLQYSPVNLIDTNYYRVLIPAVDQPLALSPQSLCWTSTAHVLWDDVLASALTPEQQRAMIDWLHWGGGLIVSGPDSLDKLRSSFLSEYLPVSGETTGPIDPARLAEFDETWSVPGDESQTLGSRAGAPWSGIELAEQAGGQFVPGTARLVAERRVGRGRIVVTAFRLTEPDLTSWPSFDSFFNACLLERPSREFLTEQAGFRFVGEDPPESLDPSVSTAVRYLTRDEAEPREVAEKSVGGDTSLANASGLQFQADPYVGALDPVDLLKAEPGVAAWNDFSWISSTARQTLQAAAGISVPKRQFVLKMIGLYLLVIVPINWLVFRLAGRVEWAWIAVPLIAVVWGVLVVWLAQLDIGFARAQIEVDVLEVQPGYARGHLTRYTALYSSLSSDYDLRFDDRSAVALPFSTDRQRLSGQSSSGITLTSVGERDLAGYPVSSNSTGMIHGEQMYDLGGAVTWSVDASGAPQVTNHTKLKLSGAAIVRRRETDDEKPIDEAAWLGDLEPGASAAVHFVPYNKAFDAKRDAAALTTATPGDGELNLRNLIDCVQDHRALEPGEVRLVAWRDEAVEGIQVRPSTAQQRAATLVVVHLQYGQSAPPQRDENLRPLSRFRLNAL
jgi:hypothetical protein